MKPTTVLLLLGGLGLVAWILYLLFGRNGKTGVRREATSSSDPNGNTAVSQVSSNVVPRTLVKIVKNEESKLSLVTYNSVTNEILNSRILDFEEASIMTGGFSNVCLAPPGGKFGATGYAECSVIRGR